MGSAENLSSKCHCNNNWFEWLRDAKETHRKNIDKGFQPWDPAILFFSDNNKKMIAAKSEVFLSIQSEMAAWVPVIS